MMAFVLETNRKERMVQLQLWPEKHVVRLLGMPDKRPTQYVGASIVFYKKDQSYQYTNVQSLGPVPGYFRYSRLNIWS